MKDKNNIDIKVGDLIKKTGFVKYADGDRYKISRKTWRVSKVEGDKVFYREQTQDFLGREIEQDVPLPYGKDAKGNLVEFLVVGDSTGFSKDFQENVKELKINAGSVQEKYRVLKDIPDKQWKKGEIVAITGKVSFETLENGWLEKVSADVPHKHTMVVVDTARIRGLTNNLN